MKTILFINGCIRGENSRTLKLANTYIAALKKSDETNELKIIEKDLTALNLSFRDNTSFNPATGAPLPSSPELAEEFAAADEIILAAPFWELMFPTIVHCYIEAISRVGTTFQYSETGSEGLCKATSFKYIYTSGNYLAPEDRVSEIYLKKLLEMYGITNLSTILVDGLDIQTNDAQKMIDDMCEKITNSLMTA